MYLRKLLLRRISNGDIDSYFSEDSGKGPYCELCFDKLDENSIYRRVGRP